MNNCFNVVGGGKNGIKARAYASESALPAVARDGEIAVISKIAAMKVYVQNAEPSEANVGDVWIFFAANGTLPAVGGGVTVYPQKAYQYTADVWTAVPMKVYKDGSWVDATADVVLYIPGDEAEEITGGWYASSATGLTKNTDRMEIYQGFVSTALKIDLTNYSLLKVELQCMSGTQSYIGIGTTPTAFVASTATGVDETAYFTRVVDLEAVKGEYYIMIQSRSSSTPLYVSKVELIA